MPERLKATPSTPTPKVDVSRLRYADEMNADSTPKAPDWDSQTQRVRPGLPVATGKRDTANVSIWEAFGVKPPSQLDREALDAVVKRTTGSMSAVNVDEPSPGPGEDTHGFSPLLHVRLVRLRPLKPAPVAVRPRMRSKVRVRSVKKRRHDNQQ
jgi:hypothetical protein